MGVRWGTQVAAALAGSVAQAGLGPGYGSAAVARGMVILSMVALHAVRPPAASTALSFAFAKSSLSNLLRFAVGVAIVGTLAVLQRRPLAWLVRPSPHPERAPVWRLPPGRTRTTFSMNEAPSMNGPEATIAAAVQWLRLAVETTGAAIVALGAVIAVVLFLRGILTGHAHDFNAIRLVLARYLALALEFQLGADILSTAIAPSLEQIGKLGAIAVIRTGLNYFLSLEMKGERSTEDAGRRVQARAEGRSAASGSKGD